jgi:hypothetical protein
LTADPGYWGRSGRIVALVSDTILQQPLQLCYTRPRSQSLSRWTWRDKSSNTVRRINPERTNHQSFDATQRTATGARPVPTRFHQFTFTSPLPLQSCLSSSHTSGQNNTTNHQRQILSLLSRSPSSSQDPVRAHIRSARSCRTAPPVASAKSRSSFHLHAKTLLDHLHNHTHTPAGTSSCQKSTAAYAHRTSPRTFSTL